MPPIKRVSKNERKWLHHYELLKKYKETHGNCDVPRKHEPRALGVWVKYQRHKYRLVREGKSLGLDDDRIRKLESIGFRWFSLYNEIWDERFQELKKYMETHGHCNVSIRHGSLGVWVNNQRRNHRLLKEGKSSVMSEDRIHKLESIDFCWSCKRQHDNGETYMPTTIDAPPNTKSGHQYLLRSTSSTAANAPDIVTSTMDFRDSHTDDEAAACDTLCDENIDQSSKETCDGRPVFRPFLLGTGYC